MVGFNAHIMFIDDVIKKMWVYSTRAKNNVVSYMHILFVFFLLFEKKNYIEIGDTMLIVLITSFSLYMKFVFYFCK